MNIGRALCVIQQSISRWCWFQPWRGWKYSWRKERFEVMFQFPLLRVLSMRFGADRIRPLHGNTKVAPAGRVIGNRIIKMLWDDRQSDHNHIMTNDDKWIWCTDPTSGGPSTASQSEYKNFNKFISTGKRFKLDIQTQASFKHQIKGEVKLVWCMQVFFVSFWQPKKPHVWETERWPDDHIVRSSSQRKRPLLTPHLCQRGGHTPQTLGLTQYLSKAFSTWVPALPHQ